MYCEKCGEIESRPFRLVSLQIVDLCDTCRREWNKQFFNGGNLDQLYRQTAELLLIQDAISLRQSSTKNDLSQEYTKAGLAVFDISQKWQKIINDWLMDEK
mgnify:CR=1 FL=1